MPRLAIGNILMHEGCNARHLECRSYTLQACCMKVWHCRLTEIDQPFVHAHVAHVTHCNGPLVLNAEMSVGQNGGG